MSNPFDPLAQFKDPRRPHSRQPQVRDRENVSRLIEEEERLERLEVALHREVAEFLQATTRRAAQVIGNLKQRTRELTDDAVVAEMREFIEVVSRKAEYLIQELVRRHEQQMQRAQASKARGTPAAAPARRPAAPLPKAARRDGPMAKGVMPTRPPGVEPSPPPPKPAPSPPPGRPLQQRPQVRPSANSTPPPPPLKSRLHQRRPPGPPTH